VIIVEGGCPSSASSTAAEVFRKGAQTWRSGQLDHAAKLNQSSVTRALNDAPVMHCNDRIDQIAAQRSKPRERAILVCTR
jgi:hypothetical protein